MALSRIGRTTIAVPRWISRINLAQNRTLVVTSFSTNNNTLRINYRENGVYRHVKLQIPDNSSNLFIQKRSLVNKDTSYSNFGHKRRPANKHQVLCFLGLLTVVFIVSIEKT